MLKNRFFAWPFISLVVASSSLFAQPPADDEEGTIPEIPETRVIGRPDPFPAFPLTGDTLLSPTRTETLAGEVGSSVTVITEEQIRESGQSTVSEVLRGTVGLDVVRQGGPGGITSVFMRGANSQHTKVLLDGIPINDPSNATRGFDFSTLTVDNIERIEILRGPQSVLYGSDAIGGVVNIITKRGQDPLSLRVGAMGGSFGTSQESLNISGGNDVVYYSLSGSYLKTHGISAADENLGNIERDRYRNETISGRVGWTPHDQVNVDYVFRYTDAITEVDRFDFFTSLPFDDAPLFDGRNLSRIFYNRVQVQSLAMDGLVETKVGFNLTHYERPDESSFAFASLFEGETRLIDWQTNLLLTENNVFSVGASYLQEDARQMAVFPPLTEASQNNAAVFIQDQFNVAGIWFATIGFRWDNWNTAGPAQTYRVTNLVRLLPGTAVHGTIGTGFRAPALAENLFAFGNPALLPEESKGWDVGLEQQFFDGRLIVDATYFRNDYKNLILFNPLVPPFGLIENVGVARSSGVELTAYWDVTACTSLSASYTHTDSINLDRAIGGAFFGLPLLRRPQDKASLGVHRRFCCNRARVSAYLLYIGDRIDRGPLDPMTFAATPVTLDDYITVNLSGHYNLNDRWQLFGRIDNLFDEQYQEVFGFGTPGISGYAGANFLW